MVELFLNTLTQYSLSPRIELAVSAPSEWTDTAVSAARMEEATRLFGSEKDTHPGRWAINELQLATAISFAFDDDKFPRQQAGPSDLYFSYRFL
jgi:hypothetical protein